MLSGLKRALPDIAIVLILLAFYLPVFQAGFIWDDDHHLTQNPVIIGNGGLRGIWTTTAATYYPLVLTSFWIQHAIWGLQPFPYHLVNLLMHAFCAILLRRVLLQLKAPPAGAWLGAVFWAIHPVQVESAAWVTELKNTQSGVFYLLAILLFLKWRESGRRVLYPLFLLSAVCALLSKTSTVMLPVVALLCAWWLDGQWSWKSLKGLWPFFGISAVAGLWTIWEQKFHSGALGAEWAQTVPQRIAVAGDAVWFYLGKIVWPNPLIFLYSRWSVDAHSVLSFVPTALAIAALIVLWWYRDRLRPEFFALAYFVVSLFPVLDFFDVYFFRYSFVGDHFQYLASMGPLALAGVGLSRIIVPRNVMWISAAAVLIVLGVLTTQHASAFVSDEILWKDTIAKNPDAWLAYNNLAATYLDRNDTASATAELEAALSIRPDYPEAQANLANILFDAGRYDEAVSHFERALEHDPNNSRMQDSLGVSLMMTGRVDEGIDHIRRAIDIVPNDPTAYDNLGIAFHKKGNLEEALAQFKKAVDVNPNGLQPRMRLGAALLSSNRFDDAAVQFREAVRLSPNFADAHKYLGMALAGAGNKEEAIQQLQEANHLDPTDQETKDKLAELHSAGR